MQIYMKNIKMIVSDLDQTLLKSDKTISDFTIKVLEQCQAAGIKTAFASARGKSAERITKAISFDGKVNMNGAIAKIDNKIVYDRLIPYHIARPFLMACDKYGIKLSSEISGMHYTNFDIPASWSESVSKRVDFSKHDIDAEKICLVNLTNEDITFVKSILPDELYLVMSTNDSESGFGMIMHKEATKSKAVFELARLWGISTSEIVAFGDDYNDIDLLSQCGISVAVANAIDEVKAITNFICDSNDNDGVAKWLLENI